MNMRSLRTNKRYQGFTLIEVLICIALIALALLGLAEIFTLSVLNNMRSDRMTNANFLAQQQVDFLRNLTSSELATLFLNQTIDEPLDVNNDSTLDYRRITLVRPTGNNYEVRVLVFSAEQINTDIDSLIQNPDRYRVKARLITLISR